MKKMKKIKLLTSLSVLGTLGGGVATTTTSCSSDDYKQNIITTSLTIGDGAWNPINPTVGQRSVLDYTTNALTWSTPIAESDLLAGILKIENDSSDVLGVAWDTRFGSFSIAPKAAGSDYNIKLKLTFKRSLTDERPGTIYVVTSNNITVSEASATPTGTMSSMLIEDDQSGYGSYLMYNKALNISPYAPLYYSGQTMNIPVVFSQVDGLENKDSFDAATDLEIVNGLGTVPNVSLQNDSRLAMKGKQFNLVLTYEAFQSLSSTTPVEWTIKAKDGSSFKSQISPLTFNVGIYGQISLKYHSSSDNQWHDINDGQLKLYTEIEMMGGGYEYDWNNYDQLKIYVSGSIPIGAILTIPKYPLESWDNEPGQAANIQKEGDWSWSGTMQCANGGSHHHNLTGVNSSTIDGTEFFTGGSGCTIKAYSLYELGSTTLNIWGNDPTAPH